MLGRRELGSKSPHLVSQRLVLMKLSLDYGAVERFGENVMRHTHSKPKFSEDGILESRDME